MTVSDFPDPRDCRFELVALGAVRSGGKPFNTEIRPDDVHLTHFGSTWEPEVLMTAYRQGIFPMPYLAEGNEDAISWWSPNPRAVFIPGTIRCSRSLAKSMRQFRFSVDRAFDRVIAACGDVRRPSGWIDQYVIDAFTRLHSLGIAHSVEVWHGNDLVGGLYGVDVGGVFAGESMFHEMTDASKAALVVLDRLMNDGTGRLIDTQWMTDHLFSMGAVQVDRRDYIAILEQLRDKSALDWPARASTIGINVTK